MSGIQAYELECRAAIKEGFNTLSPTWIKNFNALKTIAETDGMTQLHSCCVNKTCEPAYDDDGEKVSHCLFQYGVSRGYNENASLAKDALAEADKFLQGIENYK